MTSSQRRKQNVANAQKSTGPVTDEGKDASRRNALKHGLAAQVLTLPGEDPAEVRQQADAWAEACRPETHEEDVLVEQAALATLRMRRLAQAEHGVVTEQVRHAEDRWDHEQELRVMRLVQQLDHDPARAVLELKTFSEGTAFLLERWESLQDALQTQGCWNSVGLIHEAVRLYGYDPDNLARERPEGYDLALLAVCSNPDYQADPVLAKLIDAQRPPEWRGRFGEATYPTDQAQALLTRRVAAHLMELGELHEALDARDVESRATAKDRALALADTPENRLMVRYLKATESSFHRTIKTLAKLQADRGKTEAAEGRAQAPKAPQPNEADPAGRSVEKSGGSKTSVEASGAVSVPRSAPHVLPKHSEASEAVVPTVLVAAGPTNVAA